MINSMTPKERVLAVLNQEEPDRVPIGEFGYIPPYIIDYYVGEKTRTDVESIRHNGTSRSKEYLEKEYRRNFRRKMDFFRKAGLDFAISVGAGHARSAHDASYGDRVSGNIYVDKFGRKWDISAANDMMPWLIGGGIQSWEEFDKLCKIPDYVDDESSYRFVDIALEEAGDEFVVMAGHQAPMTCARLLRGTEDFLKDLYRDLPFAEALMDYALELAQRQCDRYVEHGIEVLHFNDDLGDSHGPFASPRLFRRVVAPRFKKLFDRYRSKGTKILLHADGGITPLLSDLIDYCGIDALNPLQTTAGVSLKHVKENFGEKICLFGGIPENTLFLGTPQEVAEIVKEALGIAAPGGGYILASDGANILNGVPLENFFALVETGKKCGKYRC